ncbi:MAG: hypothetical protein ACPGOY_07855 [Rhodospirillaceae bacterium]
MGKTTLRPFDDIMEVSGFMRCDHHYIFVIVDNDVTYVLGVLHEKMELFTHLQHRLEPRA